MPKVRSQIASFEERRAFIFDTDTPHSEDFVEFRLFYQGRLSANAAPKHKHEIRRTFHRQLKKLWDDHPVLSGIARSSELIELGLPDKYRSGAEKLGAKYERCGIGFVPLVNTDFDLVCSLDVLFLRRSPPGAIIKHGGDIDNRLKTLVDALGIPTDCSGVDKAEMAPEENPIFCLLQDDALITEIRVTTDVLLSPLKKEEHPNDVILIIKVSTKATRLTGISIGLN